MGLFSSSVPYDRTKLLAAASKAQAAKRKRRAIALYRRVLAVESGNAELHAHLAPMLADTGQEFDAWLSYSQGGRALEGEGNREGARQLFREATERVPREMDCWLELARLERLDGAAGAARETLLRGARYFRTGKKRARAIYMLRRAREVDPWHVDTVIALARLLAQTRQKEEALMLLHFMSDRVQGRDLLRIRRVQLGVRRSLAHFFLWLRASLSRRGPRRAVASSS